MENSINLRRSHMSINFGYFYCTMQKLTPSDESDGNLFFSEFIFWGFFWEFSFHFNFFYLFFRDSGNFHCNFPATFLVIKTWIFPAFDSKFKLCQPKFFSGTIFTRERELFKSKTTTRLKSQFSSLFFFSGKSRALSFIVERISTREKFFRQRLSARHRAWNYDEDSWLRVKNDFGYFFRGQIK